MRVQVALFEPADWLDKLIATLSRGHYSHACLVLHDGSAVEARPFRPVQHIADIGVDRKVKQNVQLFDVELTDAQYQKVIDFLQAQIGKKYDYPAVFGIVLNGSEDGRAYRNKWFCSELVAAALEQAGIKVLERIPSWKISPVLLSYSNILKFKKNNFIIITLKLIKSHSASFIN
jgi:uncharacterized protein YycO